MITAGEIDNALVDRPSPRKVEGRAAVATWSLLRNRRPLGTAAEQAGLTVSTLAEAEVCIVRQQLNYRAARVTVRPAVARLLARLVLAAGRPVPVADLCAAVYGRPASLRAIRQSAFRASRAMERVDCPLVICCHAATVFARHRVRSFERISRRGPI